MSNMTNGAEQLLFLAEYLFEGTGVLNRSRVLCVIMLLFVCLFLLCTRIN